MFSSHQLTCILNQAIEAHLQLRSDQWLMLEELCQLLEVCNTYIPLLTVTDASTV